MLIKNNRGDLTGILFLIVSISVLAIFLLIVGTVVPLISDGLIAEIGISEEINNSFLASSNTAQNTLPVVWMIMFGGLTLGLFTSAYMIRTHPIFVPIFILLLIIPVMIAIPISNAYEELSNNVELNDASLQQLIVYFFMINLPYVSFVISLITLIITFAKPDGIGGNLA